MGSRTMMRISRAIVPLRRTLQFSTHTLGRGKGKGSGKESGSSIFKGVNAAKDESQTPEKDKTPFSQKWKKSKENWSRKLETEKKFREEQQEAYKDYLGSEQGKKEIKYGQGEILKVIIPCVIIVIALQIFTGANDA